MARMVVLLHEVPGGASHFDWLLQRPGEESEPPTTRRLMSFRVRARPDDASAVVLLGERLKDHRLAYLDYQGLVSGGRGSVKRVAKGFVGHMVERVDEVEFTAEFDGQPPIRWSGKAMGWIWLLERVT